LVSVGCLLLECSVDRCCDADGNARIDGTNGARRRHEVLTDQRSNGAGVLEGEFAGEQLVDHDPKAVLIACGCQLLSARLLR